MSGESSNRDASTTGQPAESTNSERREALIKLGKYAAYATPIVIASLSAAHGKPISGVPAPPPAP